MTEAKTKKREPKIVKPIIAPLKDKLFLGTFILAAIYIPVLYFLSSRFLTAADAVVASLSWVLFMLTNWEGFSPKGRLITTAVLIIMALAFVVYLYFLLA